MKKLIYIALVALGFSCDDKKGIEKDINTFEISINNSPIVKNQAEFSVNENCGFIFSDVLVNNDYSITMELSDAGVIRKILLFELNGNYRTYKSVDFIPSSNFNINNFFFDRQSKKIGFDFGGQLLNPQDNLKAINIKGKVEDKTLNIVECKEQPFSIKAKINNAIYRENKIYILYQINGPSETFSFSEDGYSLVLLTAQELKNMSLKAYTFDNNSITNKISFEKYIGPVRSSLFIDPPKIDGEWEKYNYQGSFTILERITSNSRVFTKGVFSMNVYDKNTNELKYAITNGEFML
jgi:hypothetical protein